ncbi:MAG: HlyC/CorC family transporter [Fimbriimonadales bacterium]|nr:HlyC/CorC family transporter [Fimbriimonadales bacterium]
MMDSDSWRWIAIASLIAINAFFVASEYALVGARRSRIAGLASRGNRAANSAVLALDKMPAYIAGIQLAITMAGIGLGAIGESFLAQKLTPFFDGVGLHVIATAIAFLSVTFALVVLGELVPKYLIIRDADRALLILIFPLKATLIILRPLTFLLEFAGFLVLRPFGIDIRKHRREFIAREEYAALVRESQSAGEFAETHARMVTKALRLADLQADDVMIPRVDVSWIDVNSNMDQAADVICKQPHTRLLAVEGVDLDEVVGILYIQDAMKFVTGKAVSLRSVVRPAVFIPPNVSLERIIDIMREKATQMIVVRDEHGGTSGILTLEDIVEEVFGELDDQIERAQPRIEQRSDGRIVMRGDVRTDELVDFLGTEDNPLERETISTIIVDALERTPKLGDSIETPLGTLRVDNMTRSRITRVSLIPAKPDSVAEISIERD